ncbi:MAG TPA: hypothetical protein DFK15_08715 [Butyricimonas sp.]|jgi:hypothetical protein|uniref:hypothetical protein n=1 Tax=Butyricimonas sp. TaxID=1969738 RepID=UPI000ED0E933|nr:hypothetical protein [Butyricimonas sp.]HAM85575.1 hypothetical protein [Butyricimonas sp.]HCH89360.1 hypothetical protein [Butyricimonas sp.]
MCQYLLAANRLLESIPSIYEKYFPKNSQKSLEEIQKKKQGEEELEKELENSLSLCREIEHIGENIYYNLNLSVISGSYAKNQNFEEQITKFKEKLTNLPAFDEIYDCVNNCFIKVLLDSLKQYQRLTHSFHKKINTPYKRFLVNNYIAEIPSPYSGKLKINLDNYAYLFEINIYLAHLDNNFSLNEKNLRNLFDVEYDLKNHPLQDDIARKIISDKCNLLISKFKTKYDNDEFFRSLSISHEFIDSDINPTQVSIEYLKEFYNYIINLYPKNREDNFSYLEEYYHKKNGVATQFKDFFIFAQYYRKVSKRTSDINELITNYKNKFEPLLGKNKFFDRSYYTCYNYLFNNKISLLNKIGFENIHDINVTFIETLALQSQTGTYNFFPFYKLAQCYCSLFRSLLKEKNFSNCIHTAQHIITKLEESNNYFEKYLIQNNRFDSFHFQPDFEECCCKININNQDILVFIASAFVIPDDFKKYKNKLAELKADHQTFRTIIATQEFINTTKEENQKQLAIANQNSKDAIKIARTKSQEAMSFAKDESQKAIDVANDSQRNNIQILSVFAALVIFAMGNFQVYRMVNTFHEAIIFTFSLAFSLCLFSVIIWFIVNENKRKRISIIQIIILLVLVLGFGLCSYIILSDTGKDTSIHLQTK